MPQLGNVATNIAFKSVPILTIPGLVENLSGRLPDAGGESISFPVWESSVSAQTAVRDSRTGVTPDALKLTSYSEAAVSKCISVDADRLAIDDASEDCMRHLAEVVGKTFGAVLQAALIDNATAAVTGTTLIKTCPSCLTVNALLEGKAEVGRCGLAFSGGCVRHLAGNSFT